MDVVVAIHRQAAYGHRSIEIQVCGATATELDRSLRRMDGAVECRIAFVVKGRVRGQAEVCKGACITSIIDDSLAADDRCRGRDVELETGAWSDLDKFTAANLQVIRHPENDVGRRHEYFAAEAAQFVIS